MHELEAKRHAKHNNNNKSNNNKNSDKNKTNTNVYIYTNIYQHTYICDSYQEGASTQLLYNFHKCANPPNTNDDIT